jgi:hypothetical protein
MLPIIAYLLLDLLSSLLPTDNLIKFSMNFSYLPCLIHASFIPYYLIYLYKNRRSDGGHIMNVLITPVRFRLQSSSFLQVRNIVILLRNISKSKFLVECELLISHLYKIVNKIKLSSGDMIHRYRHCVCI